MNRVLYILIMWLGCLSAFAQTDDYNPSNPPNPSLPEVDTTKYYNLYVESIPAGLGSFNTTGGKYVANSSVYLYAYANDVVKFEKWVDKDGNVLSTNRNFYYSMPASDAWVYAQYSYDPTNPANPEIQDKQKYHTLYIEGKPAVGGSFGPNGSVVMQEGESNYVWAYTHSGFKFLHWEDAMGNVLSTEQEFQVTMGTEDMRIYAIFEYAPNSPSNPGANFWESASGQVLVDDFRPGNLSDAIYNVIGGSSNSANVTQIIVSGKINSYDFSIANNFANCIYVDYSRTSGATNIPWYCFSGNGTLTHIKLPSSIESISSYAFNSCTALSEIECYAVTPPSVGYNAFAGLPDGVVVRVPIHSVELYENAEGWKELEILPLMENVSTLEVCLPEECKDGRYKNMSLELINVKSGQKIHFVVTDRISYSFSNIIHNTSWNAVIRNQRGDVFGKIDNIEVADKDVTVMFESLQEPQNVTLTVKDKEGNDVTAETQITWTDAAGNYLTQSSTVNGVLPGNKLGYNIVLPQNLAMAYSAPSLTEYTIAENNNNIVCTLSPLQKVVVTGKVYDLTTKSALSGAVVSASQTFGGKFSKTTNVKTDSKGQYAIEIFRVPTSLAIASSGYVSQTIECDVVNVEKDSVSVSNVLLKSITGAVISTDFTYTKCPTSEDGEGEVESYYSDYNNVDYVIFNKTQNRSIGQFNVQYPQIVLLEEVNENDELEIIASSRISAFVPVKTNAVINAEQRASTSFNILELGKLRSSFASNNNAKVVGSLYDDKGKLIKTYDYSGGSLIVNDLPDGGYTLVTMGSSNLFNTIYDLNQLPQTGLTKDVDYVQNSVNVESGKLTVIFIEEVPTLDESKLYYTGNNTSFNVNKSSIVAGNYLTLTGHLDFKDAYSTKVSNVSLIVDLPESCSFVENSVMVGNSISSYNLDGNRVTIPMANYTDRVRFCIIPTLGGDYAPSALVQFDVDGETITQPIGSANYTAKDLTISVPATVAKTTIPVSGTAVGISDIEIYDGDVLIGQTRSIANGNWSAIVELDNPYNLSVHNIYAKVTTKVGLSLVSESQSCTYDKNDIYAKTVEMTFYNGWMRRNVNVTFDLENQTCNASSYSFYHETDFTFAANLSNNDTTVVKGVTIGVYTDRNGWVDLKATYNSKLDRWVAVKKFGSNNLPAGVKVEIDKFVEAKIDAELLNNALANHTIIAQQMEDAKNELISTLDLLSESLTNNDSEKTLSVISDVMSVIGMSYESSDIDNLTEQEIQEHINSCESLLNDNIISSLDSMISACTSDISSVSEYLEGVSVNNCNNLTEEILKNQGFYSITKTDGTVIYVLAEDGRYELVDFASNTYIVFGQESKLAKAMMRANNASSINDVVRYMQLLGELINNFQSTVNAVFGAIESIESSLNAANKKLTQKIGELFDDALYLQRNGGNKFLISLLDEKIHLALIAKQANNKILTWISNNVRYFRPGAVGKAFGAVGLLFTARDAMNDLSTVINLHSKCTPCPNDKDEAESIQRGLVGLGVAAGIFYTGQLTLNIASLLGIEHGIFAAIPTGGASLVAVGVSIGLVVANFAASLAYTLQFENNITMYSNRISHLKCEEDKCPKCHKDPCECEKPCPTCGHKPCVCCIYCHHYPCICTYCSKCGKRVQQCTCKRCSKCGKINCICKPIPEIKGILDPSGYVYEGVASNRLEGVTATCYYKEMVEDMYGDLHENIVKWDAAEYAQKNPLFTDEYGMYAWDVPQGLWQVKFEKEGYETTYSEWLPVPPPQLDINIAMKQNVQPTVKSARAFENAVEIEFDKYMMPELLTTDNIRVVDGENSVEGTIELLNEEVSYEGNEDKYASKVRFTASTAFNSDEIILQVSNRVKSYAGIRMQDDYSQTFSIEQEIREIKCDDALVIAYGKSKEMLIQVLPAVASAGKTLKVKSSSSMILSTDVEELTLDNEGKATLVVHGELPGAASITYSIDGYDLTANTMVSVDQNLQTPDNPSASIASGSVLLIGTEVSLSCPTSGASIYYTIDGSCPCGEGAKKYDGTALAVTENTTLKIMAVSESGEESDIVEYVYTLRQTNQQIPLAKGWNWVSHNQYNNLMSDQLQINNVDRVKTQDGEISRGSNSGFIGHIDDVNATEAFKVYTNAAGNLSLGGVMYNPYLAPVSLTSGWNWIGYPLEMPMSVDNAFSLMESELGDCVVNIDGGYALYDGDNWIGTLETLIPGQGYLFKSASDKELTYNLITANSTESNVSTHNEHPWTVDKHAYPDVMCVTADLYDKDVRTTAGKYLVGAFVDGECRGIGCYVDNTIFLSVYGDKNVEVKFKAMNMQSSEVFDITEKITFKADVVGTLSAPYSLHLQVPVGISNVKGDELKAKSIHNVLGQKVKSIDRGGVFIIDGKKRVVTKRNEHEYVK